MGQLTNIEKGSNAYTCKFPPALLNEIRESFFVSLEPILSARENESWFEGGQILHQPVGDKNDYYLVSFADYPLLWFSCDSDKTYAIYRRFLDAIEIEADIKDLIDFEQNLVLYSGFLVIGDRSPAPKWHVDYFPNANAYTLLTPLFDFESDHGNLLYKDVDDAEKLYAYELGEAIILGERFQHSTEPYSRSNKRRVLVSMTFGTDKLEHWDVIAGTIASQSRYQMLPCGHVRGSCMCLVTRFAQKRIRAKNG